MEKFKRIHSPSSINLFKQCPRRYYYLYVMKLPTLPSIHLIRGNIVHSVLEYFFEEEQKTLFDFEKKDFKDEFRQKIQRLFLKEWNSNLVALQNLGIPDLQHYFEDSLMMLSNFVETFIRKIEIEMSRGKTLSEAFKLHTPEREKRIVNTEHGVQGFIDAIEEIDGNIRLIDYKTSKKDTLTDAYKLQLAIYALLYKEEFKKLPHQVAINFLKFKEKDLDVDEKMVEFARKEVAEIHEKTKSEDIKDYPKNITPLCKWRGGQCDFYEKCFGPDSENRNN